MMPQAPAPTAPDLYRAESYRVTSFRSKTPERLHVSEKPLWQCCGRTRRRAEQLCKMGWHFPQSRGNTQEIEKERGRGPSTRGGRSCQEEKRSRRRNKQRTWLVPDVSRCDGSLKQHEMILFGCYMLTKSELQVEPEFVFSAPAETWERPRQQMTQLAGGSLQMWLTADHMLPKSRSSLEDHSAARRFLCSNRQPCRRPCYSPTLTSGSPITCVVSNDLPQSLYHGLNTPPEQPDSFCQLRRREKKTQATRSRQKPRMLTAGDRKR